MSGIDLMLAEDMTIVVTPAAVARSAAMSLVSMPPVPKAVPRDFVETVWSKFRYPVKVDSGRIKTSSQEYRKSSDAIEVSHCVETDAEARFDLPCSRILYTSSTTLTGCASGFFLGLSVYLSYAHQSSDIVAEIRSTWTRYTHKQSTSVNKNR
jgi:hypothetical protein